MKEAIIIFVRNPELGKVKTRLAKGIGDERALQVYIKLLQHTHNCVSAIDCDRFVYYVDEITMHDLWVNNLYHKKVQQGNDLGERMMLAFSELFQHGYSKIIIIGSDCPGLSSAILKNAFNKLNEADIVLGPSTDGGYYLLGMKIVHPQLFQHIQWSTDTVLKDTQKIISSINKSATLLPELTDIDEAKDLQHFHLFNTTSDC